MVHRYWIEFDLSSVQRPPAGLRLGCGVTAPSLEEALALIRELVFGSELPPHKRVVEDVDVSKLDARHVRPNMGVPSQYGIWFPLGYDTKTSGE